MALPFHFLHLLLACAPMHIGAAERDAGITDASPPLANATAHANEECRDSDSTRIDGMARWACALAIASESADAATTDTENTP